ncbi:MAG: heme b synthase [candidate division Zixibacteria bacterium]|nr:heme b synthase [candidate division Zixibacteria bacterium]
MSSIENQSKYLPRLIAWEITRSCNLDCKHCRAKASLGPYSGELSTQDCFKLLDDIASLGKPIIILTGGEPMLREDIYDIAKYGNSLGLRMVMAPCGLLINPETAKKIREANIQRISISLDGASEETHDSFRGVKGAFKGALQGIKYAKEAGIDFQINTTVSKYNLKEIPQILDLAKKLGASVFDLFLLVPTGRGKDLVDQEISPQEYEEMLNWVYERSQNSPLKIKLTCAPHYNRVLLQKGKGKNEKSGSSIPMSRGCMGGLSFAFISHIGKVQICGFLETECGDIRKKPFSYIWENSEVFKRIRDIDSYGGRCGYCEYRKVCGGCRARAYGITGDYLAEEPYCVYQPKAKRRVQIESKR